jgi:hypothetical protein
MSSENRQFSAKWAENNRIFDPFWLNLLPYPRGLINSLSVDPPQELAIDEWGQKGTFG